MILHENAEIRIECDSWDFVTITNKRSNAIMAVTIAGLGLLAFDLQQPKGSHLIVYKGE